MVKHDMAISVTARDKCLTQARKKVQWEQKWGRCYGTFLLVVAVVIWAMFGYLCYFVYACVSPMLGNANVGQNQAAQDVLKQGWRLGLALGFLGGCWAVKGVTAFSEGIKMLRGDPMSQILVEFHDTIEAMMQTGNENRSEG